MAYYVYSTLSADVNYNFYVKQEHVTKNSKAIDIHRVQHSILIKGGANVANKRLDTPLGVVTQISDEDAELLQSDEVFQKHLKGGYVSIQKRKVDPEVPAADMQAKDTSAPVTPEDGLEGDVNNKEDDGQNKKKKKDRSFVVKNNLE